MNILLHASTNNVVKDILISLQPTWKIQQQKY